MQVLGTRRMMAGLVVVAAKLFQLLSDAGRLKTRKSFFRHELCVTAR